MPTSFRSLRDLREVFPQLRKQALYRIAHRLGAIRVGNKLLIRADRFERYLREGDVGSRTPTGAPGEESQS